MIPWRNISYNMDWNLTYLFMSIEFFLSYRRTPVVWAMLEQMNTSLFKLDIEKIIFLIAKTDGIQLIIQTRKENSLWLS